MKERKNKNRVKKDNAHKIINLTATLQSHNKNDISSDVLGSYTGVCADNEVPTQDADDL